MKYIDHGAGGSADVLALVEGDMPEVGAGEVLIKVHYAGVNRPDVQQRLGKYPPPADASPIIGLEVSGEIFAVGQGVDEWKLGDKVCALLPGGGYAEYVACNQFHALAIPEGMTLREAAALPETAFTVWSNVVMRGGLQAGERFLVHGGTSGIGTMAIQVARALGARVWATAGSAEKCDAIAALGATPINYREADYVKILQEAGGANLILDMVGGSYIERNLKALDMDGRLVMIAFLGGPKAEINFAQVMSRRLTITGSTLRPQSDAAKGRIADALRTHLWPLIGAGKVRILIDSEYPLAEAAAAHQRMESSAHIGKIVLKIR